MPAKCAMFLAERPGWELCLLWLSGNDFASGTALAPAPQTGVSGARFGKALAMGTALATPPETGHSIVADISVALQRQLRTL
mmetsp:Transcript_14787/g.40630  ORF Transcript_14787/g.40630 Transcript_14787/m.40630 type:complete len:82 (-) Transcript_14787:16-261(-)